MKKSSLTLLSLLTGILLGALGMYALTQKNQTSNVDPSFEGMLQHTNALILKDNFECENLKGRTVGHVIASMVEAQVIDKNGELSSQCSEADDGTEYCDLIYSSCMSAFGGECWSRYLRGVRIQDGFDTKSFSCTDVP